MDRQLGSRVRLIRKLEIDFDALCPTINVAIKSSDLFRPSEGLIDVTNLLHALWVNDAYPDIRIVYPKEKIQNTCGCYSLESSDEFSATFDTSVPALNRLIRSMVRDELRLRRYLRTLSYIGLERDASGGRIVFASTSDHSHPDSRQEKHLRPFLDGISYVHATEGQNPQMLRREPASLLTIPHFIRYRILRYAVTSTDVQKISVDMAFDVTSAMYPLFINHKILRFNNRCYLDVNDFLIEMKSTTPTAGFCTFERLISLLDKVNKPDDFELRRCQFRTWPDLKSWPSYRISIAFYLPNIRPWSLDGIRFDAVTFVRATPKLQPREPIHIDLRIQNPSGVQVAHLSKIVSVEQLRRNVLTAWSGLDSNPLDMTDIIPQIWVNGHGSVEDVVAAQACLDPYHKYGKKYKKYPTSSLATAYEAFDALRNLCNVKKAYRRKKSDHSASRLMERGLTSQHAFTRAWDMDGRRNAIPEHF